VATSYGRELKALLGAELAKLRERAQRGEIKPVEIPSVSRLRAGSHGNRGAACT